MDKKPRKITVVFLILLALFGCLVIQKPKTAEAWSGDLPTCDFGSFDPVTQFESHRDVTGSVNDRPLDDTASFIVYEKADGIYVTESYFDEGNLLIFGSPNRILVWQWYSEKFDKTTHAFVSDSVSPTGDPLIDPDLTCIKTANHVTYNDSYTGEHYPEYSFSGDTSSPSPSPTPTPTPSDSPSPSPTPSTTPPYSSSMTEEQAKIFAQKVGILFAFGIGIWIIRQFRFGRNG